MRSYLCQEASLMDSIEGDKAFDEAVSLVQQQISTYKERTNQKLQKLEATIEIAKKLMVDLLQMKAQRIEEGFVNTDSTSGKTLPKGVVPSGTIPHLKMNVSTIEGAGIFESLHVCEQLLDVQTNYDVEPVYDEEPGEGQECWPEHEFILAALRGDNSYSSKDSKPSQPEICTSERSDTSEDLSYIEVIQDRNNHNSLEKMTLILLEEVSSVIFANRETVETFLSKRIVEDFPTDEILYNLDCSNFDKRNILIFDPGGQVQNKHLKGYYNKSKDMIRSEVKLEGTVMKNSVGTQFRHLQDTDFLAIKQLLKETSHLQRKVFIIEMGNSTRLQNIQKEIDGLDNIVSQINEEYVDSMKAGMMVRHCWYPVPRQGSPGEVMRLEVKEAWRRKYTITIFDPGGKRDYIQVWRAV